MDVVFAQPRGGHAHEFRLAPQLGEAPAAGVAHAGLQSADELIDDAPQRAFVRHAPFDPLGDELVGFAPVVLKIPVAAALPVAHGFQRPHPAILLVGAALIQNRLARALLGAGEQAADHDRLGARGQRLDDVARKADTAVRNDRHARARGHAHGFRHRGELGHADPGNDARRADGGRADADLDSVRAGVDQRLGPVCGRHVAGDHLDVRKIAFERPNRIEHAGRVAVRGVQHQHVRARLDQGRGALLPVVARADRGGDPQPAVFVLARVGMTARLLDVLDRDEALEVPVLVHDEEFFDAVPVQDFFGFVAADARPRRDEIVFSHDLGDQTVEPFFEAEVAVREDADQRVALRDRQPGDVRAVHDLARLGDGDVRADRDRVGNHPALVFLDPGDFRGLRRDVQIAVDDADPAGLGQGDGRPRLGHRVHGRADERRVQADRARQGRRHVGVPGHEVRLRWQQQDVVERQTFGDFRTGHCAGSSGDGQDRRYSRAHLVRREDGLWCRTAGSDMRSPTRPVPVRQGETAAPG